MKLWGRPIFKEGIGRMSKHTEGTWRFAKSRDGLSADVYVEQLGLRQKIANVRMPKGSLADVRLITQAPPLLIACRHALPLLEHLVKFLHYDLPGREFSPNRVEGDAAIEELYWAITRAEGGKG